MPTILSTDFATAKAQTDGLYYQWGAAANRLRAIPGVGSGPMGLTPDDVKGSPEYREAYAAMLQAEAAYKRVTPVYTKRFKKEIAAERNLRRMP